jgi:hypothetical protein
MAKNRLTLVGPLGRRRVDTGVEDPNHSLPHRWPFFQCAVEPFNEAVRLGVVRSRPDWFYLQQPINFVQELRREVRSLVREDLFGDPHPGEELD